MDSDGKTGKPCRTCTDFKTWSSLSKQKISGSEGNVSPAVSIRSEEPKTHKECPVDKDELGRSTWNLLHTVAAFYPDQPTEQEKTRVADFFKHIALMYPCEVCASDFQKQLERFPPKTDSQEALSQWLCRAHNRVNLRTGKDQFDCSRVNERWRDGWKDGSCD